MTAMQRVVGLFVVVSLLFAGFLGYRGTQYQTAAESGLPKLIEQATKQADITYRRARAEKPSNDDLAHLANQAQEEVGFARTSQRSGDPKAAFAHLAKSLEESGRVQNYLACNGDYACWKYQ